MDTESAPDSPDVIVVNISRALAENKDVAGGTRGDWLVTPRSARHLRYIVGVSRGSHVEGIFAITCFEVIPYEKPRVRFTIEPLDVRVRVDLPRMYRPFLFDRSERVFSVPSESSGPPDGGREAPTQSPEHNSDPQVERGVVSPQRPRMSRMSNESPTSQPARVIQFPHPGFEYSSADRLRFSQLPGARRRDEAGLMGWKPEGSVHNRKYLVATGSVMESSDGPVTEGVRLGFWGEWEAPSRWRKAEVPVEPYHPSAFHEPLLPAERPAGLHQNTDPMVFGDHFLYTNCKMYRKAMRGMPAGSIVLFGRGMQIHGEPRFVLDTCFVVDHRHDAIEMVREDPQPYGDDVVTDLVLAPLLSGSGSGHARIHHYVGRRPEPGTDLPFSFFPTVRQDERPEGFARPVLCPKGELAGLLTENLKQGLKPTTLADADQARGVWDEVVTQVRAQGCVLGVHAQPPAWGSA